MSGGYLDRKRFLVHSDRVRKTIHGIYTLIVLFVSLWPRHCVDNYVSESIQRQDSWIHVTCFLGLAVLSLWAYGRRDKPFVSRGMVAGACIVLGVVLEIMQGTVPGINRNCSLDDAVENGVGALLGILLPLTFWPDRKTEDSEEVI